jgi:hypothetical protein
MICKSGVLDFVHLLYFNKNLQRFGSWIFFRLQVKRRIETLAVGPLPSFIDEDGRISSFRKVNFIEI